jgi:hypothetical protein
MPAINLIRTKFVLSYVNCSVTVLLLGSNIQQCHSTNPTEVMAIDVDINKYSANSDIIL